MDDPLQVAELLDEPQRVRLLLEGREAALSAPFPAPRGSLVAVSCASSGGLRADSLLASPKSALASMYRIAARHRLTPFFPPEVEREVEAIDAAGAIEDPDLVDLTHLPFVTIDGAGTRDLDQAVFIERVDGGYLVRYAIADASYFVRPDSALFAEALRRGASYYFPGLSIPMLPRRLSEGLVSLNPEVLRRAAVFEHRLDSAGAAIETRLVRARIRSRAKLSFEEVQRFLDDPAKHRLAARDAEESVTLLAEVGRLRFADAERRDVIAFRRSETEVKLDGERLSFVFELGERTVVERYNEQLSLLCNVEGARLLRDGAAPELLQPIYRVHPGPTEERRAALRRLIAAIVARHGLDPGRWRWAPGLHLGEYLARLPESGRKGRIASAIHRQAVLINARSSYAIEPAPHFGVGAEVYGRFSAPMREIVGVFLHKEAFEQLAGGPGGSDDEALRLRIIERANEARELQKRLDKEANRLVIDALFARDLRGRKGERPWRSGTVMGMTRGKIHVVLDEPAIEVKVYSGDLARDDRPVVLAGDEAAMLCGDDVVCRIGDEIALQVRGRDRRDRWSLALRR